MKFYTDIRKRGNTIFHRGYDENGKQFFEKIDYKPTLFLPTQRKTDWKYFYTGQYVEPLIFETMNDAYNTIDKYKSISNMFVAGMDKFEYQFLVENYPNEIQYDFERLRILNFDIEVDSTDGFPQPHNASETITSIAAEIKDEYYVFGYGEYTPKSDNVHYIHCDNEYVLLNKFIDFWRKIQPDIVSGWNSSAFDIPYLYNRITGLLGEDRAKLLSPWQIATKKNVYIKNQSVEIVDLYGIQLLDYLDLYRVFTFKKRESYKLDHISHIELGEKKLSYEDMQNTSELLVSGKNITYDETKDFDDLDEVQKYQKVRDKLIQEKNRRGI